MKLGRRENEAPPRIADRRPQTRPGSRGWAGRCIRTIGHYRPDLDAWVCDLFEPAIATAQGHGDAVRYAVSKRRGHALSDGSL